MTVTLPPISPSPTKASPRDSPQHSPVRSPRGPSPASSPLRSPKSKAAALEPEPAPETLSLKAPSSEERKAIFKSIDRNGNGILSFGEISDAVKYIWPNFGNNTILKRAVKAADLSGDGTIGRKEFGEFGAVQCNFRTVHNGRR